MRTDMIYEVVDMRDTPSKIEGFASLFVKPDGFYVWHGHTHPTFLEWNDDIPDSLVDREDEGIFELTTPQGRVLFQTLTFDVWKESYEPNFDKTVSSQQELYAYLSPQVLM